jgi:hypothetical protein
MGGSQFHGELMPHLKSRESHIPGGFRFLQPQTGWSAPSWQSFAATVSAVISHRRGNPPLITQYGLSVDPEAVASEVDTYNAAICKANGWTEYYTEDDSPAPFPSRPYNPPAVGVAGNLRKTAIGVKAMQEWLGLGLKPVEQTVAENRAIICVTCKENDPDPNWIQKLDAAAAVLIKGLIEAKNKMSLTTAQDAKLFVCSACDCNLRLKVWTPPEVVQNNTTDEIRKKLPDFCWVKTEAKTK